MKKRIISGVVMAAIVAVVLYVGLNAQNLVITAFLAILAGVAMSELIGNAAGMKDRLCVIVSSVYTTVMVFLFSRWSWGLLKMAQSSGDELLLDFETVLTVPAITIAVTVLYIVVCAVLIMLKHEDFDLAKIGFMCGMPLLYAFAFSTLGSVITGHNGIYYLLLILNFACVCDMGAYFVGVTLGKHKLCPSISPNKTVEGALGGIVSGVIVALIIIAAFGVWDKCLVTLLLAIPLCITGMLGDLFASIIKRKAQIKDYGKLIPGHGGVLDRVDSILFISPLVFCLIALGVM